MEAVRENCKDELLRRPLGRSDDGDDDNSINVHLLLLWRYPDDSGTPGPRYSSENKIALTDIY